MKKETVAKDQTNFEEECILINHLRKQRQLTAKIFPHCGENGYPFTKCIQGCPLTDSVLNNLEHKY